jgi:deoxyribodipyrimidine photolyase
MARLEAFLTTQLASFSHEKANVDRSVTSRLSPWIHVGTISVRFMYYRVSHAAALLLCRGILLPGPK